MSWSWRFYLKKGISLFPANRDKIPVLRSWMPYQKRYPSSEEIESWEKNPGNNLALVCGKLSNLTVLDADSDEAIQEIESYFADSFEIPSVDTPRGGRHFYFQFCKSLPSNSVGLGQSGKIDIRSEGGYILAPPSKTENGEYKWNTNLNLETTPLPKIPEALINLLKTRVSQEPTSHPPQPMLKEGTRDNDLFHASVMLFKDSRPRDQVERIILAMAKVCDPPFPEKEALRKVESAWKRVSRNDTSESVGEELAGNSFTANSEGFSDFLNKKRTGKLWGHNMSSFPQLTRAMMGLREITVLSAEAKVGKSTFVQQIASNVLDGGIPVLYYDFENGRYNLMARELCRRHRITFQDLFSPKKDSVNVKDILQHFDKDLFNRFYIIQNRSLTVDKLQKQVQDLEQTTGTAPLIVIDSLQKLPMDNLRERRAAIDIWLRGFEAIKADAPDLSVILISELSRESKLPKESGDIEYTGFFIMNLEWTFSEKETIKRGDDGRRILRIQAARDVPVPSPINLRANFKNWEFHEEVGGSI